MKINYLLTMYITGGGPDSRKPCPLKAGMQLVSSDHIAAICFPFSTTLLCSAAADNMTH